MVRGAGLAAVSLGASRRKLLVERPRAIRRDFQRRIYWTMVWILRRGEIAAPAVAHNWLEVERGVPSTTLPPMKSKMFATIMSFHCTSAVVIVVTIACCSTRTQDRSSA